MIMLSAENVKKLLSDSTPLGGSSDIEKRLGKVLASHLLDEISYWLGVKEIPDRLQISIPYNEEGFHKYGITIEEVKLLGKYSPREIEDTWYHFGKAWFEDMNYNVFFYMEDGEIQITLDWGNCDAGKQ